MGGEETGEGEAVDVSWSVDTRESHYQFLYQFIKTWLHCLLLSCKIIRPLPRLPVPIPCFTFPYETYNVSSFSAVSSTDL